MTLAQIVGLHCRHQNKSRPICRRQHCLDCGEVFVFDRYDVSSEERQQAATVDHYVTRDRNVTRIERKLLRWRKAK